VFLAKIRFQAFWTRAGLLDYLAANEEATAEERIHCIFLMFPHLSCSWCPLHLAACQWPHDLWHTLWSNRMARSHNTH